MSNKLLSITVKGKEEKWSFRFYGNLRHIEEWREDGLDVEEINNVIPKFIADMKLTKQWCFLRDIFNFKNPPE